MIGAIAAGAAVGIAGGMIYAMAAPSSQVFGPTLVRLPRGRGLALTFDDGPSESTPAVLDALARHGVRATFFFCGANVRRLPEIARRAAAEGHAIGNHTWSHPRLYRLSAAQIEDEIARTQAAIEDGAGLRPRLFRPPYGIRWFGLFPALEKHALRAVMWSACAYDWRRSAAGIEAALRAKARDGAIVLLHDGDAVTPGDHRSATALALDRVLPVLARGGSQFVSLDGSP
jgi:peptidoglycan/xylan/chitin deacetylase (PgdA/CDA1 family)